MKAVNDYRILMPNIPYYETGLQFNQFDVVYYTGIYPGTYIDNYGNSTVVSDPYATGYYYCSTSLNSGDNLFYNRPDGKNGFNFWTQDYFFVPTYGSTINFEANFFKNEFQDYYTVLLGKSENVVQVSATLQFKGVSDNEAKALNHFYQNSFLQDKLADGQGLHTFDLGLFPPHTKKRPYYIKRIENNFENVDLNNVTLHLESPFASIVNWKENLIPFTSDVYYEPGRQYSQHDYVFINNAGNANGYYYFTGATPSSLSPLTTSANSPWTQNFYFKPDLVQTLNFESNIYKNNLDNFYLYQNDGINPNFFEFDLSFNGRTDKEAKAILHFLETHNGIDLFKYDMYSMFTGTRNFYAPKWSHTYNFLDNNSISVNLNEFKFIFDTKFEFNSTLIPTGIDFGFLPNGFQKINRYEVQNDSLQYPISYTIKSKVDQSANPFFNHVSSDPIVKEINAGEKSYFDISFSIPNNPTEIVTQPLNIIGYFPVDQDNENVGVFGNTLHLEYTGQRVALGGSAPYNFLSGVSNCVASPFAQDNKIGLKIRWTVPESGFYFNTFYANISSKQDFYPPAQVTGKTVSVSTDSSTYLYNIGTPGLATYECSFLDVEVDTPFYAAISGFNTDYTNHTGQNVFASGVSDINYWKNPAPSGYEAVQTGLTNDVLGKLGIAPPVIEINKEIVTKTIKGQNFNYVDVYDYIKNNLKYQDQFLLYSGIVLNFDNCYIGPSNASSNYDIYNTGCLIITGDFSDMQNGLTLNFYNNSTVYGKGGSIDREQNTSRKVGKNALYVKCNGTVNVYLDSTSVIAAGGAAGENIKLTDIVNQTNGKFSSLKNIFRNEALSASGVFDSSNKVNYNTSLVTYLYNKYNLTQTNINSATTSTKGSSLFYDFFDTSRTNPYLVFGGAGAPYGQGTGYLNKVLVNNAELKNSSQAFILVNVVDPQNDFYQIISSTN